MRRGPSLGPIVEGMDIIVLLELHEHEVCKVLNFEGYMKMSVFNELTKSGKGYGGVKENLGKKSYKWKRKTQISSTYG